MGKPRNRKAAGGATSSAGDLPMPGSTPARRACATVAAAAAAAAGEVGTAAGAGLALFCTAAEEAIGAADDGAAGVLGCRAAVGGEVVDVRGEPPPKAGVGGQEAESA